jgi:hypothetical protein
MLHSWLLDVWDAWQVLTRCIGLGHRIERCAQCSQPLSPQTTAAREYPCCLGCAKLEIEARLHRGCLPLSISAGDVVMAPMPAAPASPFAPYRDTSNKVLM